VDYNSFEVFTPPAHRHTGPLNMPVSLVHFTTFFQGEDKLTLVECGENRDLWSENYAATSVFLVIFHKESFNTVKLVT